MKKNGEDAEKAGAHGDIGGNGKAGEKSYNWATLKGGMWIVLFASLGGVMLQHLFFIASPSSAPSLKAWSVGLGLAAFAALSLLGLKKNFKRYLGSVKFAVPVLFFVTVYSVIGTLVVQGVEGEGLRRIYGGGLASLFEMLFFQDIFHSFSFSVILGMGTGGLMLAIFPLQPLTLARSGKILSHLGLIITMGGAAVGGFWGVKGDMGLVKGQTADRFVTGAQTGQTPGEVPLGFALRLEDFQLEFYEPSFRVRIFEISDQKQPRFLASADPSKGEMKKLEKDFGLVILDYWPHYEHVTEAVPLGANEDAQGRKVVSALGLKAKGAAGKKAWMFHAPDAPPQVMTLQGGLRLAFLWSEKEAEAVVTSLSGPSEERHVLKIGDQEMAVEPGGTYELPGHAFRFKVTQFFNDFVIDLDTRQPTNRSDKPVNPAIQVVFLDEAGNPGEQGWLFAKFGSFHGEKSGSPLSMMKYTYVEGRKAGSGDLVVVGEKKEVWTLSDGQVQSRDPLDLSGTRELAGTGLAATDLFERARLETRDQSRSDAPLNPVAQISVDGSDPVLLGAGKAVRLSETLAVVLSEQEENIKDFLSTLSVIDGGKTVLTKTIEVNDPLTYGGYSFYQSNYDPNRPGWTGLQVVRDPGMNLVYAGLIVLLAGVTVVIFVVPVRRRLNRGDRANVQGEKEKGA